jgi:excisionase family DNA binding protein
MTREQVSKRLYVSLRTLDKIIAEGHLVGGRIGGRRLLFRQSDVDAYVLRQIQNGAA